MADRRRVALTFTPDELLEALAVAGYRFAEGSRFVAVVDRAELDQVHLFLEGASYPVCEPGCEPPRFAARDVRCGLRVVAEAAAAAVDMQLVPRPVPPLEPGTAATLREADRTAAAEASSAQLGDAGIGVGMAVGT